MIKLIIIGICLLLNGLFAAIEIAFISVRKNRMQELAKNGNASAAIIVSLQHNPERVLSIIQICITLVGFLSAAIGGVMAKNELSPLIMQWFSVNREFAELLAIGTSVLGITYFSVVIGELVPKSVALRHPQRIILLAAPLLQVLNVVLTAVVTVLEISTKIVIKIITLRILKPEQHAQHQHESVDLLGLSGQTQDYILKLVGLDSRQTKAIILPWDKVALLNDEASVEDIRKHVITHGHTRFPVMHNNTVIGILNSKEFHAYLASDQTEPWQKLIRKPIIIAHDLPLVSALRRLQEQRQHLGIVYEHQDPIGVVTIEDILEEVIGDVFDEDDDGSILRIMRKNPSFRYLR